MSTVTIGDINFKDIANACDKALDASNNPVPPIGVLRDKYYDDLMEQFNRWGEQEQT